MGGGPDPCMKQGHPGRTAPLQSYFDSRAIFVSCVIFGFLLLLVLAVFLVVAVCCALCFCFAFFEAVFALLLRVCLSLLGSARFLLSLSFLLCVVFCSFLASCPVVADEIGGKGGGAPPQKKQGEKCPRRFCLTFADFVLRLPILSDFVRFCPMLSDFV